ncbi:MAG: DUF4124 domain-containing protein [Xanthomonadales bacterium]|nr:DUF4124 domain-containing protein [Xanthomonadales bacterium]
MKWTIASTLLAIVVVGLTLQPEASAEEQTIYKWLDEEGVVNYTARPPEGVDYEEVGIETREPVEADAADSETQPAQDSAAETTPPEQPEMTRSEPDPEVVAERCAQARSNIDSLNQYQNVTVRGDDGEQRRISDEERTRMIEEAQAFIEEWC